MAGHLVLDASAGVEILDRSFTGRRLSKDMDAPGTFVWTVEHFRVEVAKVLRRDVLTGDLEDAEATRRVLELANWKLRVVRISPLLVDAWKLRNNITIHDALYVVLARRLGATLVTGDNKLGRTPGLKVNVRTV